MGIPTYIAIGAAGGAATGYGFTRLFGASHQTGLQFGSLTSVGGAVAGLATGVAARHMGPVKAALAGAAAASLVPIAIGVIDGHMDEPNDVLGAMLGVSSIGIAGGSIALLAASLLMRR